MSQTEHPKQELLLGQSLETELCEEDAPLWKGLLILIIFGVPQGEPGL